MNTNRRYIGIELDDKYVRIARKRVQEAKESIALFGKPQEVTVVTAGGVVGTKKGNK